jgi:hypothetical protein
MGGVDTSPANLQQWKNQKKTSCKANKWERNQSTLMKQ